MSAIATRIVRQRGFLPAFITTLVVFGVVLVQSVLGILFSLTAGIPFQEGVAWDYVLAAVVPNSLLALPFSVGVLLSLWFIAPIAAELRLLHVITRSLLAVTTGSVLTVIVWTVYSLLASTRFPASIGSSLLPSFDGSNALRVALSGVGTGLDRFLIDSPLVILAGVLLWIWLDRHPRDHRVSGMLDEV